MQKTTKGPGDDTSTQFCPNLACSARDQIGLDYICVHDCKRQRYRHRTGGHTFSPSSERYWKSCTSHGSSLRKNDIFDNVSLAKGGESGWEGKSRDLRTPICEEEIENLALIKESAGVCFSSTKVSEIRRLILLRSSKIAS